MCVFVRVSVYESVHVCVCVCACVSVYECVHVCVCACLSVCLYVNACVCVCEGCGWTSCLYQLVKQKYQLYAIFIHKNMIK